VLEQVSNYFFVAGWIGVDLFFVLSGFLISSLLFVELRDTGTINIKRFLLRRGMKIYPAYYVAFGTVTMLWIARDLARADMAAVSAILSDVWRSALFVQNYWVPERYHWSHSWSIAVEEHFYFLLPPLLLVTFFRGRNAGLLTSVWRFPLLILAVCAAVTISRLLIADSVHWHVLYYQTHLRFDPLMVGVAIGFLSVFHPRTLMAHAPWLSYARWLVLPILAVPYIWRLGESQLITTIGFTLLYTVFGIWVAHAATSPALSNLPTLRSLQVPMVWLGRYSYTIYLGHAILFGFPGVASLRSWSLLHLIEALGQRAAFWIDVATFIGLSVLLGWVLARLIEQPALRLRARLSATR
jgi:peptidoglycan/LPS O-acetylase OafA/YrhL